MRKKGDMYKEMKEPQIERLVGDGTNARLQELLVLAKGRTQVLAQNAMDVLD